MKPKVFCALTLPILLIFLGYRIGQKRPKITPPQKTPEQSLKVVLDCLEKGDYDTLRSVCTDGNPSGFFNFDQGKEWKNSNLYLTYVKFEKDKNPSSEKVLSRWASINRKLKHHTWFVYEDVWSFSKPKKSGYDPIDPHHEAGDVMLDFYLEDDGIWRTGGMGMFIDR